MPSDAREPLPKLLEVSRLQLVFGGVRAVTDVSFDVGGGEVVGLIGPNGAGKTSVFNCITGFYRPTGGSVTLGRVAITGKRPYQISRLGIRRTFQNIRLFNDLSVLANIVAGAHVGDASRDALVAAVRRTCDELGIDQALLSRTAAELPYGVQRRVEIARALVASPRILLVDEPGAGLNGQEKRAIVSLLRDAASQHGLGVVLIEHDIGMIARACDRVVVLDRGAVICEGSPQKVRNDSAVIAAYIGT